MKLAANHCSSSWFIMELLGSCRHCALWDMMLLCHAHDAEPWPTFHRHISDTQMWQVGGTGGAAPWMRSYPERGRRRVGLEERLWWRGQLGGGSCHPTSRTLLPTCPLGIPRPTAPPCPIPSPPWPHSSLATVASCLLLWVHSSYTCEQRLRLSLFTSTTDYYCSRLW